MNSIELKINDEIVCIAGRDDLNSIAVSINLIKANGIAELTVVGATIGSQKEPIVWARQGIPNHSNLKIKGSNELIPSTYLDKIDKIVGESYLNSKSYVKVTSKQLPENTFTFNLNEDFININISYHCVTGYSYLQVYTGSNIEGEPKNLLEVTIKEPLDISVSIGEN